MAKPSPKADAPCPCGRVDVTPTPSPGARASGRPLSFAACCGPWLDAGQSPADAHSLMRSRYSAFVLERAPYLLQTWHAAHRPTDLTFDAGVRWLGLEVRQHRVLDADHAEVEFVARQKPAGGPAVRLHERSRFLRQDGVWFYVDGDLL